MTREDCNIEALDALVQGELPAERAAAVAAHADGCERCRRELVWLRSERSLLSRRGGPSPERLWAGIEQRLGGEPIVQTRDRRRGLGLGLGVGLGAIAAALAGVATFVVRPALQPHHHVRLGGPPAPPSPPSPPSPDHDAQRTSSRIAVRGPVTLQLAAISADVGVEAGPDGFVTVTVENDDGTEILLPVDGDRVMAHFDGGPLRDGSVHVELPRGSHVELDTVSGDVDVQGLGGDAKVRSTSGDVTLRRVGRVDVQTTSGDVHVEELTGTLHLRTTSGDGHVVTVSDAPQLDFESSSGDLEWSGRCAAGCRLSTRSSSGDIGLALAHDSSFRLRFITNSGDLSDDLGTGPDELRSAHGPFREDERRRFGAGEGTIECHTSSGDLQLSRR